MWEKNKQQSKHYNNRNCFKSQFTLLWMLCKLYTELYTRKTVHKMPKSKNTQTRHYDCHNLDDPKL